MFKSSKGEETRARILDAALQLFRENGFDRTGMRDVAERAGMSLGAAYHYFGSKDAIVFAYYEDVQREHERRVLAALPGTTDLEARLRVAFQAKLDIVADDRPLLRALLRYAADPAHPLSFLGAETRALRFHSIAIFAEALGDAKLPDDVLANAPTMLWGAHMAILLYFVTDGSEGAARTRRLADGAVALIVRALALTRIPIIRGLRRGLITLLDDAGLTPPVAEIASVRAAWHAAALAGAQP
jgi:AcrR family transcriptional regulator